MRRPRFIARQSRRPSGLLGRVVTAIMERQTVAANDAAVERLDPRPGERVLEIGFGPGRSLDRVLERIGTGVLWGIDLSPLMVRSAEREYRARGLEDRPALACADAAGLPFPERSFDAVYTIHTIYFWDDPESVLREVHEVLVPGGRLVAGFHDHEEARGSFPEAVYEFRDGRAVMGALETAGFVDADLQRPLRGDPGLAIVGARRRTWTRGGSVEAR